jgi:hypothetical protein
MTSLNPTFIITSGDHCFDGKRHFTSSTSDQINQDIIQITENGSIALVPLLNAAGLEIPELSTDPDHRLQVLYSLWIAVLGILSRGGRVGSQNPNRSIDTPQIVEMNRETKDKFRSLRVEVVGGRAIRVSDSAISAYPRLTISQTPDSYPSHSPILHTSEPPIRESPPVTVKDLSSIETQTNKSINDTLSVYNLGKGAIQIHEYQLRNSDHVFEPPPFQGERYPISDLTSRIQAPGCGVGILPRKGLGAITLPDNVLDLNDVGDDQIRDNSRILKPFQDPRSIVGRSESMRSVVPTSSTNTDMISKRDLSGSYLSHQTDDLCTKYPYDEVKWDPGAPRDIPPSGMVPVPQRFGSPSDVPASSMSSFSIPTSSPPKTLQSGTFKHYQPSPNVISMSSHPSSSDDPIYTVNNPDSSTVGPTRETRYNGQLDKTWTLTHQAQHSHHQIRSNNRDRGTAIQDVVDTSIGSPRGAKQPGKIVPRPTEDSPHTKPDLRMVNVPQSEAELNVQPIYRILKRQSADDKIQTPDSTYSGVPTPQYRALVREVRAGSHSSRGGGRPKDSRVFAPETSSLREDRFRGAGAPASATLCGGEELGAPVPLSETQSGGRWEDTDLHSTKVLSSHRERAADGTSYLTDLQLKTYILDHISSQQYSLEGRAIGAVAKNIYNSCKEVAIYKSKDPSLLARIEHLIIKLSESNEIQIGINGKRFQIYIPSNIPEKRYRFPDHEIRQIYIEHREGLSQVSTFAAAARLIANSSNRWKHLDRDAANQLGVAAVAQLIEMKIFQ